MERFQNFSDKLTGKLVFNDIIPSYTSEGKLFKLKRITYLYTLWPILILIKLLLTYLLVILYNILPINFIFIRLLSFITKAGSKTTNIKGTKIKIQNNKNQIVCCQLSSFVDFISYAQKFKCYKVQILNKTYNLNKILLITIFGKLESLYQNLNTNKIDKIDIKIPKANIMIFPEGISYNQQALIPQYFTDESIQNRSIIFASIQKKDKYFSVQHSQINIQSIIDDLSPIRIKRIMRCKQTRPKDLDELEEFNGQYVTQNLSEIVGAPIANIETKLKRQEYFDVIKKDKNIENYWDSYNGMKYNE